MRDTWLGGSVVTSDGCFVGSTVGSLVLATVGALVDSAATHTSLERTAVESG